MKARIAAVAIISTVSSIVVPVSTGAIAPAVAVEATTANLSTEAQAALAQKIKDYLNSQKDLASAEFQTIVNEFANERLGGNHPATWSATGTNYDAKAVYRGDTLYTKAIALPLQDATQVEPGNNSTTAKNVWLYDDTKETADHALTQFSKVGREGEAQYTEGDVRALWAWNLKDDDYTYTGGTGKIPANTEYLTAYAKLQELAAKAEQGTLTADDLASLDAALNTMVNNGRNPINQSEKLTAATDQDKLQAATSGQVALQQQVADMKSGPVAEDPLQAEKDAAKATIDALPNLSKTPKDEFKAQVDAATTSDEIQAIVANAEQKDAADLQAYKDKAKAVIDTLKNLSPAQQADYKTQIDNAATKPDVTTIVLDAKDANAKAATSGSETTDPTSGEGSGSGSEGEGSNPGSGSESTGSEGSNPGTGSEGTGTEGTGSEGSNPGTGSEGEGSAGEGAGTVNPSTGSEGSEGEGTGTEGTGSEGEGAGTVIPGTDAEDAALEAAKEAANDTIDGLPNLSDTEKEGFKADVVAATTAEDVKTVVDAAKAQDAANKAAAEAAAALAAAKSDLEKAIAAAEAVKASDAYANDTAADKAGLDKALAAAKDALSSNDKAVVDAAKAGLDAATKVIDGVAPATANPGEGATNTEGNAGGGAQQGGENAAATQADKDALNSAIEDAKGVKDSDSYKNASDDKKVAFDAALAEAVKVYGDSSATSTQVKDVTTKLIEAQKALDGTTITTEAPAENGSSWWKWLLALIPAVLGLIGIGSYVVYVNQVDGGDRAPLQRGQANPADYIRWIQNLPARTDGGL